MSKSTVTINTSAVAELAEKMGLRLITDGERAMINVRNFSFALNSVGPINSESSAAFAVWKIASHCINDMYDAHESVEAKTDYKNLQFAIGEEACAKLMSVG